ncbi:hypothetical protein DUNSADRAFT_10748 [Dunaliella salina]|uniref:Uncharacterized protein n=1 Tax=Dunaliella salina TaxID=3046 RepID=A0ABQ7GEK4_DUNSA|nr:hypothetical protein DUNSADRAFT_10748 [Dunaliella salina]|eukprot:KAF5833042.1 hypothetical protein DUNSADRAFT_10748 [Dunaliella salina]
MLTGCHAHAAMLPGSYAATLTGSQAAMLALTNCRAHRLTGSMLKGLQAAKLTLTGCHAHTAMLTGLQAAMLALTSCNAHRPTGCHAHRLTGSQAARLTGCHAHAAVLTDCHANRLTSCLAHRLTGCHAEAATLIGSQAATSTGSQATLFTLSCSRKLTGSRQAHRLPCSLSISLATGWALLSLMLRVCGCSLLPLLPTIARVLGDLLRRVCVLGPAGLAAHPPAVRAAAYHAARAACEARGVGAMRLLGDVCMGAVSVELYGWAVQAEGGAGGQAHHMGGGMSGRGGGSSKHAAKRAKLMGAAEAVESAELDAMSFHVAAAASAAAHRLAQGHPRTAAAACPAAAPGLIQPQQGASSKSASGSAVPATVTAGLASLRAAALRALLASLLAPCSPGSRPPFLSQALQLFREGAAGGGGAFHPEVAAVCRNAGAQVEALLHPRALPISVVQPSAYAGLQELAPLPRPRMWTVLDPTPALALRTPPALSNGPPLGQSPAAHASSLAAATAAAAKGGAAAGTGGLSGDAHQQQGLLDPKVQNPQQEQSISLATTEAFKQAQGALSGTAHGGEQGSGARDRHGGEQGLGAREDTALDRAGNENVGGHKAGKQDEPADGRTKGGRSSERGWAGKNTGDVRMKEAVQQLQQQPQQHQQQHQHQHQQPQLQQAEGDSEGEKEKEGKEGRGLPVLQGEQTQGKGGQALAYHKPESQAPIAAGLGAKVTGGRLAGESSDSEGSLPDIDSGGEQGSSDDEDSEDDDMEG